MNTAQLKAELTQAIDALSTAWLGLHSAYRNIDNPGKLDGLFRRVVPPALTGSRIMQLEPVDPLYAFYAGGRAFWLLGGQRIGHYSAAHLIETKAEYQSWLDYAHSCANQAHALESTPPGALPMLWALELAPPNLR